MQPPLIILHTQPAAFSCVTRIPFKYLETQCHFVNLAHNINNWASLHTISSSITWIWTRTTRVAWWTVRINWGLEGSRYDPKYMLEYGKTWLHLVSKTYYTYLNFIRLIPSSAIQTAALQYARLNSTQQNSDWEPQNFAISSKFYISPICIKN